MTVEGESIEGSAPNAGAVDDVLRIAEEQPSSPLSPESKKRFIVEPQVLNAALEGEAERPLGAFGFNPVSAL